MPEEQGQDDTVALCGRQADCSPTRTMSQARPVVNPGLSLTLQWACNISKELISISYLRRPQCCHMKTETNSQERKEVHTSDSTA